MGRLGPVRVAALLVGWLCCAHARVTVLEGSRFAGISEIAAPLAFSPRSTPTPLEAQAAYVSAEDFSYATCPPTYRGRVPLRGAIIVYDNPSFKLCSFESQARTVLSEGGIAVLFFMSSFAILDQVPGQTKHIWEPGDSFWLPGIFSADIFSNTLEPVVAALAAGEPMRLRVEGGDVSDFERLYRSPWWMAWQVVNGLHVLSNVELAITQLAAFIRADSGYRPGLLPHFMLSVELVLNIVRFLFVLNANHSRGIYPSRATLVCLYSPQVLMTLTTGVFLAYFAQAARSVGMASLRLSSPLHRRSFAAFVIVMTLTWVVLEAFASGPVLLYKLFHISVFYPGVVLAVSVRAEQVVRRLLTRMPFPVPVVQRLVSRMRLSNSLAFVTFVVGLLVAWSAYIPWRVFAVWGIYSVASNTLSTVQMCAFVPYGVRTTIGPLRAGREAVQGALWRGLRRVRALFGGTGPRRSSTVSVSSQAPSAGTAPQRPGLPAGASASTLATFPRHCMGATASSSSARSASSSPQPPNIFLAGRTASHAAPAGGATMPPGYAKTANSLSTANESEYRAAVREVVRRAGVHKISNPEILLGVSLTFLREQTQRLGLCAGVTTREAGAALRRAWQDPAKSIAAQARNANAKTANGRPAVSKARWIISHAHDASWHGLLDALAGLLEDSDLDERFTYLWVDIVSCTAADTQLCIREMAAMVTVVRRVALVLDPWESPTCLTRLWCLYEIAPCTLVPGTELIFATPRAERPRFLAAILHDHAAMQRRLVACDPLAALPSAGAERELLLAAIGSSYAVHDANHPLSGLENFTTNVRAALLRGFRLTAAVLERAEMQGTWNTAQAPVGDPADDGKVEMYEAAATREAEPAAAGAPAASSQPGANDERDRD